MLTLAEVFVAVRPTTDQFEPDLKRRLSKIDAKQEGAKAGGTFSGGFLDAMGGIAAGVAAVGAGAAAALAVGLSNALDLSAVQGKFAAQLGLTAAESERIGGVAGELYKNAYGENLEQVNQALAGVQFNIGELGSFSDETLSAMGANALNLATIMDEDVGRVTRGVGQLMRNDLAPNAEAAFDLIAAAVQQGGNASGDLLDTIEEYAPAFQSLGFTGEQALGVLSAGLEAGARNGDLAADAFKEFSIRVVDDSKTTNEALQSMGFNAGEIARRIAEGGPAAATATSEIITALAGIADPIAREAAGVALFGTQFEDLGIGVITAMDPAKASLEGVAGASGRVDGALTTTATQVEEFKRRVEVGFTNFIADAVIPGVEAFIEIVGPSLQGELGDTALTAEEKAAAFNASVVGAFESAARFTRDTLIPAFNDIRVWWDENGPTIEESIETIGEVARLTSQAVATAWRAIEAASEAMGQVVFSTMGFIVNEILEFAERTLGAVAVVAGVFDDDLAASLRGTQEDVRVMQEDWNAKVERMTRSVDLTADTAQARASIDKLVADYNNKRVTLQIAGYSTGGVQVGDGPGAPPKGGAGGKAHDIIRREISALGGGMSISSGYRDPARNRAVGGSPTSYHMDKANPAGDVVGPAAKLDQLHARLRRVGGRELIWRAPGHYDHLHYAHEGGTVDQSWPTLPGLKMDERPVITQVGERIVARGDADGGLDRGDLDYLADRLAVILSAAMRNTVGGYDAAVGRQVLYGRMP